MTRGPAGMRGCRTGLGVDSAHGGPALEDAGGQPWRLRPYTGAVMVDGASRRGRMCWMPDTEDNDRVRHPQTENDRNQEDTDGTAS